MAVEQTRPYELGLYDGSLDPAEVMVTLDHSSWTRPKRMSLADLAVGSGATLHVEKDIVTGLSSHSVEIEFDTAFSAKPTGKCEVYRWYQMSDGTYRKEDVIWGFIDTNQPTLLGFELLINATEEPSLTGIIIEYNYL